MTKAIALVYRVALRAVSAGDTPEEALSRFPGLSDSERTLLLEELRK